MKPIGLVPELLVADLKRSLEFYINLLGFEVLYQREAECFAYIKKGNAEIMLEQFGIGRNFITKDLVYPLGRGMNFQIEVDNVDLLYQTLLDNKIEIFLPLEEKWYQKNEFEVGNRQFCVQDPDGYLLRFFKNLGQRDSE
jgi:catechol 2,3-dioxygenase-like lactoylglutathione lyase family enzyme